MSGITVSDAEAKKLYALLQDRQLRSDHVLWRLRERIEHRLFEILTIEEIENLRRKEP